MGGRQSRLGPIHIHSAEGGGRGLAGGSPQLAALSLPQQCPFCLRPRPGTHSLVFLVPHPSCPDPGLPVTSHPQETPPWGSGDKGGRAAFIQKNETHTASSPMPTRCQLPGPPVQPQGPCEGPGGGHRAPHLPRVSACTSSPPSAALAPWLRQAWPSMPPCCG